VASRKRTGLKVEDLTKTNAKMADWLLQGLQSGGFRKAVFVLDARKKEARIFTWPTPYHIEFVSPFGRGVVTETTEDNGDNDGE
jgi:hypothetical protein